MTDLTLAEIRPVVAAAMPPHVAFDGWGREARDRAAAETGIDPDLAALALPDAATMVDAWTAHADARLTEALGDMRGLKVRERIRRAVVTRFEQASGEREAVRRALSILAMHPRLGTRTLWRTADTMWRAAGDTATDYNHYTKRTILGAVYSATLLVWLDDESEGYADTHAFLDRRIDGIMRFEKAKARLTGINLPSPARFLGRLRYPAI